MIECKLEAQGHAFWDWVLRKRSPKPWHGLIELIGVDLETCENFIFLQYDEK